MTISLLHFSAAFTCSLTLTGDSFLFLLLKYHKSHRTCMHVYLFIYWHDGRSFLPVDHGTCMWVKCLKFFKSIPTPKAPLANIILSLDVPKRRASTILSFSLSGHWVWNCENNLCIDHFPHSSLMSRIKCKYCLISTSYLAFFDIFSISSYLTELCVLVTF